MKFLLILTLLGLCLCSTGCRDGEIDLSSLEEGQTVHGFRLLNLYEDAAGRVMGGRLISERTGFLVDLLGIQSVPQGFMWVKTLPYNDYGEPHACEHLLLGKGRVGRGVAALEAMTLGSSSAWTSQLNTVYHFNTLAGADGFQRTLEARLNAIINPDFSDEEIRREVSHLAVAEDAGSGELHLEEKGTVFTEMVSSFEGPGYPLWNGIGEMLYGTDHPQSNASGGDPVAMRDMVPEDLWSFHREFYRPSGMGIIASLPSTMAPAAFLASLDEILARVWPAERGVDRSETVGIMSHALPAPQPAAGPGELRLRPYASENESSPGRALFAWPAALELDADDIGLLELFLDTFAGSAGTPLYDALVASETRVLDTGATGVYGYHSDEPGHPIMLGVSGLDPSLMSLESLGEIRGVILAQLGALRDLAPGDPKLAEFRQQAESRLEARRKTARQALDRPPMFGFRRGSAGYWQDLLGFVERQPGFRKSLVLADHYDRLTALLAGAGNPWRGAIERWGLLDLRPVGLGVRPSPELLAESRRKSEAHLERALAILATRYEADGEQALLAAFKADFDAVTATLEAAQAQDPIPEFVSNPPLSLDDPLDYAPHALPGGGTLLASTFENMSSATLGLAFGLDVLPAEQLPLLPLLPALLTRAGIELEDEILDTKAMQDRLRRELTSFSAYFDGNMESGRQELVLRGTAAGSAELERLLVWMKASLNDPWLATQNLPRLRDIAEQAFTATGTRMQGSEESWVQDPAAAYRYQDNPLFLATHSFLTQRHHWFRLSWLLAEAADEADARSLSAYLARLAREAGEGRAALLARLEEEPIPGASGSAQAVAMQINVSLGALLPDLPDETLPGDWARLCAELDRDLATPPGETLAALGELLDTLRHRDNLRAFLISNSADRASLRPGLDALVESFDAAPSQRQAYDATPRILARLKARRGLEGDPVYVGLLNGNTRNGTLVFTARNGAAWESDRDAVLDALAGNLYAGGGGHGLFMRTWAAGLAYSNGYRYRVRNGMTSYYAERCPDVAQTMRFVADVMRDADVDAALLRYAVAVAFGQSRAAGPYEQRGEAMAADLVDGQDPERVRAFRQQVLALMAEPGLTDALRERMAKMYGQVMVGLGEPLAESRDGVFFLIGPESQFANLEALIAEAEEAPRVVERLYPRDYWPEG